jgi:ABC-type transport system involved in cytochrome c biogenesis permease subunit
MPKSAALDKEFSVARQLPRTERNDFHEAVLDLGRRLQLFMSLSRVQDLHVAAPGPSDKDWKTLDDSVVAAGGDPSRVSGTAGAFIRIIQGFHGADASTFNRAVADYEAAVEPIAPRAVSRATLEAWYNQFSPFFICCILYCVVFVLAAASWIGFSKPFARAAFWTLCLTLAVHTVGIIIRVYLSGRAPVTNLESSAIFIGWIVVILGAGMELTYRNGIGSVISAAIGFVTLTIFINLAKDDTMKVLEAVLDTNFWLWTHVPIVNMGYSATFLAWGLGVAYVVLGLFTTLLTPALKKDLARMIYGAACFGILFSFVGTVLGGIWADQSWGRFWGWDPKENGAVLIVLINAILLHARWGGLVRERGIACIAIFGGIVTVWSWFGTNLLGVGLHSYGFMNSAPTLVLLFAILQLGLIALANFPWIQWRSEITTDPTPIRQPVAV